MMSICEEKKHLREIVLPLLGKWSPFILMTLENENCTFAELERSIEGISRKVLAENLDALVKMGIINKKGKPSTGHPVDYSLSELGLSLLPIFYQLKLWIISNEEKIMDNFKLSHE
ncbi:winged helix-turn-helix transcriptional regulator [Staphylococcus equorum]|uniref:winged helix-turn-helix transcriptional regulator n=1 Tax=Staphylococcus equorum TaxID=246432 RepID=UPI003F5521C6